MRKIAAVLLAGLFSLTALRAEEHVALPAQPWSFSGPLGSFDRAAALRGFQVFKEVCAACHGAKHVKFYHLADLGLTEAQIKALAADRDYKDGPNDEGEMFQRKGTPSDALLSPYANDQAARAANNGALPPDQSLMTKARVGGADYVYALLTGFHDKPPAGVVLGQGMHYNAYFPGNQIAMAPPLTKGQVTYLDGTEATVEQMAHDVTTFLAWAAEPEMEQRKRFGVMVLLFLSVLVTLLYRSMKKVWADEKH